MLNWFRTLIVVALAVNGALAVDVRTVQWGFDGTVTPERFNVLSVLVGNASSKPFDGVARLTTSNVGMGAQGAPYETPCYLAPGTMRWIQFTPFIGRYANNDSMTVSIGGERVAIDQPTLAAPAMVLLVGDRRMAGQRRLAKACPEELFPPTVAACDGLASVLLDHVPRWSPAQQQAFGDWLHRGGRVHVLRDADGHAPQFPAELAVLNTTSDQVTVGAGLVVRHAGDPSEAEQMLATERARSLDAAATAKKSNQHLGEGIQAQISSGLRDAIQPHFRWGLIYTVLLVFVLAVGPGAWIAARCGVDYRWIHLGVVAGIIIATWSLTVIGRRGYGERGGLRTVAYAQSLGDGRYDVTAWGQCFVTSSGQYRIHHNADANLYASTEDEGVDGVIQTQDGGGFISRIPLYSSRPFLYRGGLPGPSLSLTVTRARCDEHKISALWIAFTGIEPAAVKQAQAVCRGRMYQLMVEPDRVLSLTDAGVDLSKVDNDWHVSRRSRERGLDEAEGPIDQLFSNVAMYAATSAGDLGDNSLTQRISVLLWLDLPAGFKAREPRFGNEEGRCCLRFDLDLPMSETSGTTP